MSTRALTARAAALTTLLVALAALLITSPLAAAHARVDSTLPKDGSVVPREPASVAFTFDETVEGSFGAVRAFDSHAQRVDVGSTFHPGGRGPEVAVRLKPGLPNGTYTATYRVISADGHPVSGGFVFSIGKAGSAGTQTVTQLAGKAGGGPVTSTAFAAARALQYGAIAVAVGLLLFLWLVLPRAALAAVDERARRVLFIAGAVGAVSGVLAVLLEGAIGGGTSLWAALHWGVVRETLATRFGLLWWLGAIGWIVVAMIGSRWRQAPLWALGAPLALLVLLPAFGGHAATQHPEALYVVANVVHVTAISAWFGGLVALLAVLPVAVRAVDGGRVPGASGAAEATGAASAPGDAGGLGPAVYAIALPRFSRLALGSVALILLTGTLQAIWELTSLRDLTDTAFGRAVLVKVLLLAAAGVFAARNHWRTVPAVVDSVPETTPGAYGSAAEPEQEPTARRLLVAVRAEVGLVVLIFAAAGALGGYPPPTQIAPGPLQVKGSIGREKFTLTVDPAQVGANQFRIAITDQQGHPATDSQELTVTAVEADRGIGPLSLDFEPGGPGVYTATAAELPAAGHWRLSIINRVSEFDEFQTFATVPVP